VSQSLSHPLRGDVSKMPSLNALSPDFEGFRFSHYGHLTPPYPEKYSHPVCDWINALKSCERAYKLLSSAEWRFALWRLFKPSNYCLSAEISPLATPPSREPSARRILSLPIASIRTLEDALIREVWCHSMLRIVIGTERFKYPEVLYIVGG